MKEIKKNDLFLKASIVISELGLTKPFLILLLILLADIDSATAFNGEKFKEICGKTFDLVEGGLGGVLMACAGVGAIVASAAGGFRLAWALVVVAVGSFILKEYQEIWTVEC